MSSNNFQVDGVLKVEGIGEFSYREIKRVLNVSSESLYQVKISYKKTGKLPHWWQKSLWLMVYSPQSMRKATHTVEQDCYSVRHVREKILGLTIAEFATLFGIKSCRVSSLEFREKSGEKHKHLIYTLLRLLTGRDSRDKTIRRLLHLARFNAKMVAEHEAVSRLRALLIPKSS